MARFFGQIGYGHTVETKPGVWQDQITEYDYYGDVIKESSALTVGKTSTALTSGPTLNRVLAIANTISIVADAFANDNFYAIRYVRWAGKLWEVNTVQVQIPRLILVLGGVYSGLTPSAPSTP